MFFWGGRGVFVTTISRKLVLEKSISKCMDFPGIILLNLNAFNSILKNPIFPGNLTRNVWTCENIWVFWGRTILVSKMSWNPVLEQSLLFQEFQDCWTYEIFFRRKIFVTKISGNPVLAKSISKFMDFPRILLINLTDFNNILKSPISSGNDYFPGI